MSSNSPGTFALIALFPAQARAGEVKRKPEQPVSDNPAEAGRRTNAST